MMGSFIVEGGVPLCGEITPSGNKNEALPVLAASLLASSPVVLRNVPHIGDINTIIKILKSLGAQVDSHDDGSLRIDPSGIGDAEPDTIFQAFVLQDNGFSLKNWYRSKVLARTLSRLQRPGFRPWPCVRRKA